jgi:hypothetical protein
MIVSLEVEELVRLYSELVGKHGHDVGDVPKVVLEYFFQRTVRNMVHGCGYECSCATSDVIDISDTESNATVDLPEDIAELPTYTE